MRRTLPLTLASLAMALAGCGAEQSSAGDFEGEERAVAEAVEEVRSAAERKETTKLCDELLTKALAERIASGGASCAAEIEKAVDDSNERRLEVVEVGVDGTRARAEAESDNGERTVRTEFELVKEGDRWRVDAIGTPG